MEGNIHKAAYKGNIFTESTILYGNGYINSWECLSNNCSTILNTKNKRAVSLSCEHNHPNDEGTLLKKNSYSKYNCSVKYCNTKAPEVDKNGFKILFLMFPPKDHNIWNCWVKFCDNGPEWEPMPTSYICSVSIRLIIGFNLNFIF